MMEAVFIRREVEKPNAADACIEFISLSIKWPHVCLAVKVLVLEEMRHLATYKVSVDSQVFWEGRKTSNALKGCRLYEYQT